MKTTSYRLKLLSVYIITLTIISILIYNLLSSFGQTNVGTISKENFKSKSIEREAYVNDFFYPYITTIKAIEQSKILKAYLSNELPEETLENYFLDIKKSMPCLMQVRFIDLQGMEKVRIDGTPIGLYKDKATSNIVPAAKLQNKSNRDYVKQFLTLQKNQLGLSKINLNKENGKIVIPKQPTLRLGMSVYDTKQEKKGILVLNLCLRTFFKLLNTTTLYNVHLIDNEGKYLNHHNPEYGLFGKNSNYSIFDEFPNEAREIISNDHYFGKNIYSLKLNNFDNYQNIKLLLASKYSEKFEQNEKAQNNFIFFTFILALLFLIIALYFAKLPDILKKKAEQEKLTSKLTRLPNRLALMKSLANKEFTNSLLILVSLNNILKIQNTYGYQISNKLVQLFSEYLKHYNNGIQEVYANSYNVFALKYKYTDDKSLDMFLKGLIKAVENYPFSVRFEENELVEFSLEITLGVSNPHQLNNTIEELNEAENALDYALEKGTQLEVFSSSFHENIQENRENLLLAKKIKKAIDNDGIFLNFQPIYNNFTEKIEKYESLIRMRCEDQLIFPDQFLPIAKQIKKYNTLSYIVIDKAFAYFKDKDCEFSINISILDIENPQFQKYLFERLDYYKIADRLVLEIVEQEGVDNYDEFFEFIKKIKEHGCKVAIDDFGSGYSNYEYIINASDYIDYLKIDGSLIKDLPTNPKTQILVGSLKFLCDNLRIKTIAEYVEDAEVLRYVESIGIDYSQGYYIGKPTENIEYISR